MRRALRTARTQTQGGTLPGKVPYRDIQWALREEVQVTLIAHEATGTRTVYLVSRTTFGSVIDKRHPMPWDIALVLDFEDDTLLINGMVFDESLSGDLIHWAELVDAVSLSPSFPKPGDCVTTEIQW